MNSIEVRKTTRKILDKMHSNEMCAHAFGLQNKNKIKKIKQSEEENRNNQNVARTSPTHLKLESAKMRQFVALLQLLQPLLLVLAGLNGLTLVAALKGMFSLCILQHFCSLSASSIFLKAKPGLHFRPFAQIHCGSATKSCALLLSLSLSFIY